MPRWPGSGGDEGEEGQYADIARRPRSDRGRPGKAPVGDAIKDILYHGPDRGMRPIEIAEELNRRFSPTEPFKGKHKRDLQSSVKMGLRLLRQHGEAAPQQEHRGSAPSFWLLSPAQEERFDARDDIIQAHKSARGRKIEDPKRIEPGRGSDPATWGDAADRTRQRRRARREWTPEQEDQRQTRDYDQRTADPMTWGIRPEVRDEDLKAQPKGRTADPMTWGKQDPPANKGGRTADPMTWGNNDPPPDDDNGGKNASGGDGKIPW